MSFRKKMGRPAVEVDMTQLAALCRMKPTLEDCAAFFKCSTSTIENKIKEAGFQTFSAFREQNMVHTRFSLVRTAIKKAEQGDNVMLIFCLKNLCGWRDKHEIETQNDETEKKREILQELDRMLEEAGRMPEDASHVSYGSARPGGRLQFNGGPL